MPLILGYTDERNKEMKDIEPASLEELFLKIKTLEESNEWIYRGQRCYGSLKTSIERMFEEFNPSPMRRESVEIAILKKFQREVHHYGITGYDFLNIPDWFSLMQHFGAPTRLLDWSHSPWVSLFFTIIDTNTSHVKSEFWALNWKSLDSNTDPKVKKIFETDHNLMNIDNFIVATECAKGVIKLNSYKQNVRQIYQQGTFLFPLNLEVPFEENLYATIKNDNVLRIIVPYKWKSEIIRRLYRMNVTYSTVYPGIDGFSRSLNHLHHIDGLLKPEVGIKDYSGFKKKFQK